MLRSAHALSRGPDHSTGEHWAPRQRRIRRVRLLAEAVAAATAEAEAEAGAAAAAEAVAEATEVLRETEAWAVRTTVQQKL
jgi:hypothetical protein